mmetsp:Transcript_19382/g.36014  ORF Transcript_19382/g.36014 Transcript_19382/m.36014 type:complete len:1964 (+) Transcript_19382:180-6071(+)
MKVFLRQFRALNYKNFRMRVKHPFKLIFELAVPIAVFYLFIYIRSTMPDKDALENQVLRMNLHQASDVITDYSDWLSNLPNPVCSCHSDNTYCQLDTNGLDSNPFLSCDDWAAAWYGGQFCTFDGQNASAICEVNHMAIVEGASDGSTKETADAFNDFLTAKFGSFVSKYPIKRFSSEQELNSYIESFGYGLEGSAQEEKISMAITFNEGYPHWDFKVRLNFTSTDGDQAMPETTTNIDNTMKQSGEWSKLSAEDLAGPYVQYLCGSDGMPTYDLDGLTIIPTGVQACKWDYYGYISCGEAYSWTAPGGCSGAYVKSGALTIQQMVSDFALNETLQKKGLTNPMASESPFVEVLYQNMPVPGYAKDGFWGSVKSLFAIFITVSFMYPVSGMVRELVLEKETKIKEGMKMMSLGQGAHTCAWVLHFGWTFWLLCIVISALSNKLFLYSSLPFIFAYFFLYLNAVLSFCFWVSTLFSRSKTASIVGVMIYFGGYIITEGVKQSESLTVKLISSIHPVAAFINGINAFVEYEDAAVGITTYTWNSTANKDGYTFQLCLVMLIFDIFFWAFMTWYCENVLPSEWGTHKHALFCVDPRYWLGRWGNRPDGDELLGEFKEGASIENPGAELLDSIKRGEGISIKNLRKSFNTTAGVKHAVDGLDLQMFKNQITCLLGHNGAGKTTTIAMLTGLIDPSSGAAFVDGKDVSTEMSEIRKDLGVCPQHDILYPELTVKEHLRLFGTFKGIPDSDLEGAVDEMIKEVGLVEKANTQSKQLSGGMKRKLSVGIAFIGGSSVVLLDEPTSGMDPYSRRFTWNVIRKMREGRTIILTTHFMDEADLLGDRIAIMADGKLRCAGSSLFLKQQFGVGYMMAIEKGPKFKAKKVMNLIKKAIPEAEELSNVGTELTMQLPLSASERFQALFEKFDDEKIDLDIVNYGVSVTTLEEVFLKVAHGGEHDTKKLIKQKSELIKQRSLSLVSQNSGAGIEPVEVGDTKTGFKPMSTSVDVVDDNDIDFKLAADEDDDYDEDDDENANVEGQSLKMKVPVKLKVSNNCGYFLRHMTALLMKRMVYFTRDKKAWFFGFALPAAFVMLGMFIISLLPQQFSQPEIKLSMSDYNPSNPASSVGGANPFPFNNAGNDFQANGGGTCDDSSVAKRNGLIPSFIDGVDEYEINPLAPRTTSEEFSSWLYNTRNGTTQGSRYMAYMDATCTGTSPVVGDPSTMADQKVLLFTNITALHAAPTALMGLYDGLLGALTNDEDVSLRVSMQPLPATEQQKGVEAFMDSLFAILMILMGFPFIPSAFIVFVVKEKENKSKHIQLVSGVSPHALWMSTWIWDFISYQVPLWFTWFVLNHYDINTLILDSDRSPGAPDATLRLFLGFGPAMAGFCYCCSFYFKSPSSAQIFVIFFSFLTGFLLPIAAFVMHMIESTYELNQTLMHFYRLFPTFCFGHGLLNINSNFFLTPMELSRTDPDAEWDGKLLDAGDDVIAGKDMNWLLVEAFAFTFLAIIIEYVNATPMLFTWITQCIWKTPPVAEFEEDSDVKAEEDRVRLNANGMRSGAPSLGNSEDAIMVDQLTKVYPGGKFAVKGLSIGIPYGSCFGLLGINGAGKTTTLSILSGEFPPSSGGAWLAGKDILTHASEVRRLIGYCPQFDALFELMTGYEHLKMYARIKGIVEKDIESCVQEQIKRMDLTQHAHRCAGGYSGGNKRKLSVACAMIGQPKIIFLDEPSTGMDPVARRFMWSVINDICCAGDTSVILTTHSMEECEALCQRIGIMVGGRFRCLGSAQHLKSKYGLGFQLEFVFKTASEEEQKELEAKVFEANNAGVPGNVKNLSKRDFCKILEGMELPELVSSVNAGSDSAHSIEDGCNIAYLASWIQQEVDFRKLSEFMESEYPGCIMREWQGHKVRYEVPHTREGGEKLRLSAMFGKLTSEKENLGLQEYSLSQTSLEQIFNKFASTQEEETGKVVGMV